MKNVLNIIVVIFVFALIGCSHLVDSEEAIRRLRFEELDSEIEEYIDKNILESGVYLINTEGAQYLLLSERTVVNGEKAGYFTNISAEFSNGTLNIYFEDDFVDDYSDERLEDNMIVFRLQEDPVPESIQAYRNGEMVPFDVIYSI